jgi:small multidrug resistance pump/quaternary ammonium compound-resistance protein SugE
VPDRKPKPDKDRTITSGPRRGVPNFCSCSLSENFRKGYRLNAISPSTCEARLGENYGFNPSFDRRCALLDGRIVDEILPGSVQPTADDWLCRAFVCAALLQGRAMRSADLGMAYILVLGIEAVMTICFSALVLRETFTTARIIALLMVITGSALLCQT